MTENVEKAKYPTAEEIEDMHNQALKAVNCLDREGFGNIVQLQLIADFAARHYSRLGKDGKKLAQEWEPVAKEFTKALRGAMSAAKEAKAWSC